MTNIIALDDSELHNAASAIFADKPFCGMAPRYQFVPTIEVINNLRDQGFQPVMATQSKPEAIAKNGFQKHMVKLRHSDYLGEPAIVGNHVPEIVIVNSHDGSSTFDVSMGIFRFVCGNGMIVMTSEYGRYKVRHTGNLSDLIEDTIKVAYDFPKALEQIEHMEQVILNPDRQISFAEKALVIKDKDNSKGLIASQLLEAQREDDTQDDNGNRSLWTTFNVVQENLIKGGLKGVSKRTIQQGNNVVTLERKTKTRPISAIQENLTVNKDLWQLASQELLAA